MESLGCKAIYQFKKVAGYKYTGIKYCLDLTHPSTSSDIPYGSHYGDDKDITLLRPATEAEKNQLIKAVEDKYKKTWNGEEWVDMKPVFKRGDYIYARDNVICIVKEIKDEINYIACYGFHILAFNDTFPITECMRLATEYERKQLDDALAKEGKRFNPQTKELENILKVGDMVIAWYGNLKEMAIIGTLGEIRADNDSPYWVGGDWRKNAIKYTSEQQYRDFLKEK